MPKRPLPLSLKKCCLKTVAFNLEIICYGCPKGSKALSNLINDDGYKSIQGPFVDLPSSILEDLSKVIYRERSGAKHFLHQIIQPQLTNFEIFLHGSIYVAITLLGERCKNLKSLNLVENINLPSHYFTTFFKNFSNLVYLNVSGSAIDDNGFNSIGGTAVKLVTLHAKKTYITDTGISYLCHKTNEPNVQRCRMLKFIDVSETRVTPNGLLFFLKFHPEAESIIHEDIIIIFQSPHISILNRERFRLKNLSGTRCQIESDLLREAVKRCPEVEEIYIIDEAPITLTDFYPLMEAKHLKKLHLGCCVDLNLNFYEGLAPVLTSIGSGLTKLVLEKICEVDVSIVGTNAPNLLHFAVTGFMSLITSPDIDGSQRFRNLDSLEISNQYGVFIQVPVLTELLSSKKLTRIILRKLNSAVDDDLIPILADLESLETMTLEECHGLTGILIRTLIETPNQLTVLRCWSCAGITDRHREDVKRFIRQENLALYWDWYPYIPTSEFQDE